MESYILKKFLQENVINRQVVLDLAYDILSKDMSANKIEKTVNKIVKKSKTEKEALKKVEALAKKKEEKDMKFNEAVKKYLSEDVFEEEHSLDEGIKFFKNSKVIEDTLKDLRIKLNSGIDFSKEEEEVIKYTINFFKKTAPELVELEKDYSKEKSKERKKALKKEYTEKVQEAKAVYFGAYSIKQFETFFKSAHFPAISIGLLIAMVFTPIVGMVSIRLLYKKIQKNKISKIDMLNKIKEVKESN